eukprot:417760-Pleurochrysis_carterae.AAC.1
MASLLAPVGFNVCAAAENLGAACVQVAVLLLICFAVPAALSFEKELPVDISALVSDALDAHALLAHLWVPESFGQQRPEEPIQADPQLR